MENMKFENNKNEKQEDEKNPFGLSNEELDDIYSGNDNTEQYGK